MREEHMPILGNYPFTVRVFNFFDPALNIVLKIVRYHRQGYISNEEFSDGKHFIIKNLPANEEEAEKHFLKGGESLAFPMFYNDDQLEISFDLENGKRSPDKYSISAGFKAKCFPYKLGDPIDGSTLGKGTQEINELSKTFWRGGTWILKDQKNDSQLEENASPADDWTLTIRKYGPDPEDDDVTVGPANPD